VFYAKDQFDMPDKPRYYYNQSAVIPFIKEGSTYKVVLITTRKKKRWTIPKGIVEPELDSLESARKEAEEEAGIKGYIEPVIFDTFEYNKWGGTCFVKVYLMEVHELLNQWPEEIYRERRIFSVEAAVKVIGREEIRHVLQKFKEQINS